MIDAIVVERGMFSPDHFSSEMPLVPHERERDAGDPVGKWQRQLQKHGELFREQSAQRLAAQFADLKSDWKSGRGYTSSLSKLVGHPSYREIVSLGWCAVPYLLAELDRDPDWWFPALREITGEDPVPVQARGKLMEMAKVWLDWGRLHNVVW